MCLRGLRGLDEWEWEIGCSMFMLMLADEGEIGDGREVDALVI